MTENEIRWAIHRGEKRRLDRRIMANDVPLRVEEAMIYTEWAIRKLCRAICRGGLIGITASALLDIQQVTNGHMALVPLGAVLPSIIMLSLICESMAMLIGRGPLS